MHSKCQHLSPTQWANVHSEAECEQACIDRGGALHTIPVGYGTRSQRRQTNRLRPPPPKASRLRRKAASTKAAGSTSSGAEDSHGGWDGHAWVHQTPERAHGSGGRRRAGTSTQAQAPLPQRARQAATRLPLAGTHCVCPAQAASRDGGVDIGSARDYDARQGCRSEHQPSRAARQVRGEH